MCVEEGRWSEKAKKFSYFNFANPRLRKVVDQSKNQLLIWKEIYAQLDSSKLNSPGLAYSSQRLEKKTVLLQNEYMRYFLNRIPKADSSWVGFICVSGDRILGTDIFDGSSLFNEQMEALLNGYVEEAILKGSPVVISDEKVKKYMDQILADEKQQAEYLKKNGKIFKYENRIIHITGVGQ
ncbi:MAG: hypothetical protein H7Y31_10105, partial [Chitinophagaceae bacterium]|nr:hypothetical protein [Chitinophagaceae bacterium]